MEKISTEIFPINKIIIFVILSEVLLGLLFFINPLLSLLPILIALSLFAIYYGYFNGAEIWILVMVFATGLDTAGQIAGGVTLFHVGWFFAIITMVISLILNPSEVKIIYPFSKFFFLFILLALVSLIYSPNFESGISIVAQSLALYVFFILVANSISTEKQFKIVIMLLLIINVIQTFYLIYQVLFQNISYFASNTVQTSGGFRIYRPSGTFGDPNVLASYMLFGIIYALSYLLNGKSKKLFKLVLIFFTFISFVGIILTFSRSGWVSLIFGVTTLILFHKQRWKILFIAIGLFFLFFPLIYLSPYGELVTSRFSSIFEIIQDPSIKIRIALMKSGVSMFFDHPFIGVGFRGFPKLYDFYINPLAPQIQLYVKESHTMWTSLLAELSIWGVLLVFLFFKNFFMDVLKYIKMEINNFQKSISVGVFAAFVALNLDLFFYGNLFPSFNMIWLNFALFYSLKFNYTKGTHTNAQ